MTENEKINGWTYEETIKTTENLMEAEQNMFKWDALRHLRDFAEAFLEELMQYRAIGTLEECREAVEKQTDEKPTAVLGTFGGKEYECKNCGSDVCYGDECCRWCGQKLDWSDEE